MARIYISSTYSDLVEGRAAVYRALRKMNHDVIAMEDYIAMDERPLDKCVHDVAHCDIYVGIFAWRYGYVPRGTYGKSITELEFREAVRTGKPCLLFLLHEDAVWPRNKMDAKTDQIKRFRRELTENYLISFFRTFDELATLVSIAVSNFDHKKLSSKNLSMQQKLDSLEKKLLEKVPEEIYPLKQLAPTELDEVGTIARSIEELFDEGAVISNAETYYRLGNYQFTIANYERAISLYRQAIQIHPVGQKPYLALGLAYEELGNWSEAMDAYRSADRLNPSQMDLASVLHNLAATYAAREDFQKAAFSYERAIALVEQYHHPTPYLYKGAAAVYERLNDRVQEHRSLKKFIELGEQLGITNKSEIQVAKRRVEFLENRKE